MKEIKVSWLDACPNCGCGDAVVLTLDGNEELLYSGDFVSCTKCEHPGIIDADGEAAWVDWFEIKPVMENTNA